jgi:phosphoribosylanthranilate isomerase
MWIKVCANTTLEDTQTAVDAGADAVGFIFAPSPRRVTKEQVREITPHLPTEIETYGVFVDAHIDEIIATVEDCRLTGVQLHSAEPETAGQLMRYFAAKQSMLSIIRVLHFNADLLGQLENLRADGGTDAVLVDSRTATAIGGTGIAYDWQTARTSFSQQGGRLRLIAAGGLKPENVAEAILTLEPWGVDVASGVESSPGRKDPQRVREFVARARAAAAEQEKQQSNQI